MEQYVFKALNRTNDNVEALSRELGRQRRRVTVTRLLVVLLAVKVVRMSRDIYELRQRQEGAGV